MRSKEEKLDAFSTYSTEQIPNIAADPVVQYMNVDALEKTIDNTQTAMKKAAKDLDFIEAARLRDELYEFKNF